MSVYLIFVHAIRISTHRYKNIISRSNYVQTATFIMIIARNCRSGPRVFAKEWAFLLMRHFRIKHLSGFIVLRL